MKAVFVECLLKQTKPTKKCRSSPWEILEKFWHKAHLAYCYFNKINPQQCTLTILPKKKMEELHSCWWEGTQIHNSLAISRKPWWELTSRSILYFLLWTLLTLLMPILLNALFSADQQHHKNLMQKSVQNTSLCIPRSRAQSILQCSLYYEDCYAPLQARWCCCSDLCNSRELGKRKIGNTWSFCRNMLMGLQHRWQTKKTLFI